VPRGGDPIAGAPRLFRITQDMTVDGGTVVTVDRVTAGDLGAMTTIGSTGPIVVADTPPPDVTTTVLRLPDDDGAVVLIQAPVGVQVWRWDGETMRERIEAPEGWPGFLEGVALSPDGSALAFGRPNFDREPDLVTWTLGAESFVSVPMPPGYVRVDAWPLADRVDVGYQVCTEGCEGRYAGSVLVDPVTGTVEPVGDDGISGGIPLHAVWPQPPHEVLLSAINEEASDDHWVDWPLDQPPLAQAIRHGDGLAVLTGSQSAGWTIQLLRDGFWHALADESQEAPEQLGTLPPGTNLRWLAPDGRWATTYEESSPGVLVDLETGQEYVLDDGIVD
jgi:hypothetical protein